MNSGPQAPDGRVARGERNRASIVNAVIALLREGVLVPTADQIAERAGVGARTVFRHFDDLERLFTEVTNTVLARTRHLFGEVKTDGSLVARARDLVERRAALSPDALLAVDEHSAQLTFGELRAQALGLAAALLACGVETGTRVAWMLPTRIDALVLTAALARLSAVQVPLLPTCGARDLAFAVRQSECALLIVSRSGRQQGDALPFAGRQFAAIVVANYLWRPILPRLAGAVAEGGLLIYETFGRGNEQYSRPRNPDHLLRAGELLEAFGKDLQVVAYEHGLRRDPKPRVVQRIAAVRGDAPVPIDPVAS